MIGHIRNTIKKQCPNCGEYVLINEINDGSPARTYDKAICPNCKTILHEHNIVGAFEEHLISKEEFDKE